MNITDVKTHLTESEIEFSLLDYFYQKHDARVWSILIDPSDKNIILVSKINHSEINERSYDILCSTGTFTGIHEEFVLDKIHQLLNK